MKFRFVSIVESLFSRKAGGIIKDCLVYDIPMFLKTSKDKSFLFYKYNADDLVEISYNDNNLVLTNFTYTDMQAPYKVEKSLDRLTTLFDALNLKGKTFLFDLSLKLPVRYEDFIPNKKPFVAREHTAFILDGGNGHIIDNTTVFIYKHSSYLKIQNNCILGMYNLASEILSPKNGLTSDGVIFCSAISGLFSGISTSRLEEMNKEIEGKATSSFQYKVEAKIFSNKDLNADKLKTRLLLNSRFSEEADKNEFSGETVNLTRVIELGLDKFMKTLKNMNKKVNVNINADIDIISMHIVKGAAFVSIKKVNDRNVLEDLKQLLNSDNIVPVMN